MRRPSFFEVSVCLLLASCWLALPARAGGAGALEDVVLALLVDRGVLETTESDFEGAGSGDITAVVAGAGLTGGATSGSATLDVAVSAGLTANADEITLDTDLQTMAAISGVRGDVLYYGASGWARLGVGTTGQVLETRGAGADPVWDDAAAGGSGTPWIVWTGAQGIAPTSNFATLSTRNNHSVLVFPATADGDDSTIFEGALDDSYASGSNLTIKLYWSTGATATTGDVVWTVEVEAVVPGTLDIDADSFDAAQSATTTTSGTAGVLATTTYALANADVDGIAAGQPFRLRVTRDENAGGDTLTDSAYLAFVTVEQ